MSMKQSSNFEESCLFNVGISCSRVMVVFVCIVVCMGSSLGWEFGCGWSATGKCHSPTSCGNSSICMGGCLAGSKGVSQSQSHWK